MLNATLFGEQRRAQIPVDSIKYHEYRQKGDGLHLGRPVRSRQQTPAARRRHDTSPGGKVPVPGREVRAGPDGRYRIDISLVPPVMVEVDGFAFHWSPEAKAYDESRRNQLRLSGVFLLVYTWRDIRFEAPRVAREVLAALTRHARDCSHAKSTSSLVTVSPPGPAPP